MKNLKQQYSYSGGGWKNIEDANVPDQNKEQKLERRLKREELEQEKKASEESI